MPIDHPDHHVSITLLVIALCLALASCDKKYNSAMGQVAARVNGEEIGALRITSPNGAAPGNPVGRGTLEALDGLIDQELLAQKAMEIRLDRDPAVSMEIEAARHRILAQSYIDRNIADPVASQEEITSYYHDHPALFEQRRVYRFNELVAALDASHLAAFKSKLAAHSKLDELVAWLQSGKQPYHITTSVKFAEQIPASLLPRITAMANDQMVTFEGPETISVVQLLQSQEAPLALEEAKPQIEKLLLEQKRLAFSQSRAKQLRGQARIEYLGAFAGAKSGAPVAPVSTKQLADKANAHVLKGLSGLL